MSGPPYLLSHGSVASKNGLGRVDNITAALEVSNSTIDVKS